MLVSTSSSSFLPPLWDFLSRFPFHCPVTGSSLDQSEMGRRFTWGHLSRRSTLWAAPLEEAELEYKLQQRNPQQTSLKTLSWNGAEVEPGNHFLELLYSLMFSDCTSLMQFCLKLQCRWDAGPFLPFLLYLVRIGVLLIPQLCWTEKMASAKFSLQFSSDRHWSDHQAPLLPSLPKVCLQRFCS